MHNTVCSFILSPITSLDSSFKVVEEITDNPINFGQASCLREIAISTFGCIRHGSQLLPHALCKLLVGTPLALLAPSCSNGTIEVVRIVIRWGTTFRSVANLFEQNPGWDELDKLFSTGFLFRQLKVVEVCIGVMIDQRDGRTDVSQLREAMSQSMNKVLRTLRTSRAINFSICIDYLGLV